MWTALAQMPGESMLVDASPLLRLVGVLAAASLGGGLVYAAARAADLRAAFGAFALGAVAVAAASYVLEDAGAVPFAIGIYLLLASAALLFANAREPGELGVWGVAAVVGFGVFTWTTDLKTGAFALASLLIVFTSLKVLQARELVHATLWLAGMLLGVAGIYLSVSAEFLALIQLLIYVGAVITLFLFTVMLTIPQEEAHGLDALELPPGVTIESVEDLQEATPRFGVGPYKQFQETNPRKPVRAPATLSGVAIADNVYGDETTPRKRSTAEKEASK